MVGNIYITIGLVSGRQVMGRHYCGGYCPAVGLVLKPMLPISAGNQAQQHSGNAFSGRFFRFLSQQSRRKFKLPGKDVQEKLKMVNEELKLQDDVFFPADAGSFQCLQPTCRGYAPWTQDAA